MNRFISQKGFTLIELLVVISIIGVLSSVLFASMSAARAKGKDSAIKESMNQFETMLSLNYDDYGSFCNLQPGYIDYQGQESVSSCDVLFTSSKGKYWSRARDICRDLEKNSIYGSNGGAGYAKMYFGAYSGPIQCDTKYSLMVYLNNGKWYCIGSSGSRGEYASFLAGNPGCYNNP